MDPLLDAIGDPHRRTLLEALREGPATVSDLAELLPIARPGVSRHLRILREAGLVDVRPEAQQRIYTLRSDPLRELDDWLAPYRGQWLQRMDALHTEVSRGKRERTKDDE
jgi:DNA-binding transcriptional ArsR family regulator